ncbi:calbindin-32-like [Tropilaelaps mercedesae]|uniref:Calbindin-32-like n=1 Tax=Tropilaelaps mercedesae TaxID=418985 RepID=A0A1V9XYB1_9ACAR|nr:calbindin-32-like [Tropilaelaps mercedesae]
MSESPPDTLKTQSAFSFSVSTNFMRQFRDKKTRELKNLTASQFMEVWSHYDHDVLM